MKYEKPIKTIEDQIEILKSRGLIVNDEEKLKRYLENISYYHLSIYFKFFQHNDVFIKGTIFEDILNIYIFDQKLRLLISDILERIEKSFKARLIYTLSLKEKNPMWISDGVYFQENKHREKIDKMISDLKDSKEIYIKHFYQKYTEPEFPPAWMIIESFTFGQSVLIYRQLTTENKKIIDRTFDLNKKFMESWFYGLSLLRNICAHHGRLWNKEFSVKINQSHKKYKDLFFNSNGNRLFNYILIMFIINNQFNPNSEWIVRLKLIIDEYLIKKNISISHMGFPEDWEDRLKKAVE